MSLVFVNNDLKSTATNAYDLLGDIDTIVRDEPSLVLMSSWLTDAPWRWRDDDDETPVRGPQGCYASCRTAGCIAGWAVMLTAKQHITDAFEESVVTEAGKIFGFTKTTRQSDPDWSFAINGLFCGWVGPSDSDPLDYGTPEYAAVVSDRIQAFRAEHAERLRRLPVVSPVPATASEPELVGV